MAPYVIGTEPPSTSFARWEDLKELQQTLQLLPTGGPRNCLTHLLTEPGQALESWKRMGHLARDYGSNTVELANAILLRLTDSKVTDAPLIAQASAAHAPDRSPLADALVWKEFVAVDH